MEYRIQTDEEKKVVECLATEGNLIKDEPEALDLVAACGENGTNLLLIHSINLPAEFFQLKTGLAGRILLKFTNYHLKVAAVLAAEEVNQGRFQEWALETNRGNEFRIFYDAQKALDWLVL